MGRAVKKNGLLDYPRMYEEAKQALTTLGHPEIDVKMECGKLVPASSRWWRSPRL